MQLLCYSGLIHVRDLALMLEEVLYYYRPHSQALTDAAIQRVLSEYDQWVTANATHLDIELVSAATTLLTEQKEISTGKGYFQQQKLVSSLRFGNFVQDDESLHTESSPTGSIRSLPAGTHQSVKWRDIRRLIDTENDDLTGTTGSVSTPRTGATLKPSSRSPKLSVAARAALKRKSKATVTIAHSAVPFHKFARWLYHQLDNHNN